MLVGEPGAVIVFDKLRHATALHEAGHAVAAYTVGSFFKASIRPAGHSLGRVIRISANEGRWITRESLISEMVIILAGRVAEEVERDKDASFQVGAGAADDLQKATIMARRMVTEWGFGSKIGSKVLHEPGGPQPTAQEGSMFPVSSQTLQYMDDDIAEIMSEAHKKSRELLSAYEPLFRAIARELEKRHDLSLLDVRELPEAELEAKPTSSETM